MQLILHTKNGGNIRIEFTKEDTLDNIRAKLRKMGYRTTKCHIKWTSPQLFVHTASEKTICLGYNCSDTISDLKSKISATECIPCCDQILFFAGMALENSSPISRYNISQGSILNLVHTTSEGFMSIPVVTNTGETISIDVNRHFSARRVRKLLKDQIGGLDGLRLVNVNAGEELRDRQSLYLLENGSSLRLVDDAQMASRIKMKIYVTILRAQRTIELDVASDDTISHVKKLIHEKVYIPIDRQVLYLPQKRLDDEFTLAKYYIFDKATLHLVESPEHQTLWTKDYV